MSRYVEEWKGGALGSHLHGLDASDVGLQDVDVSPRLEFRILGNLLVGGGFVADKADDNALGVAGVLADELILLVISSQWV